MKKSTIFFTGMMILFMASSCLDNKHAKNYNDNEIVDESGSDFIKQGLEAGLAEIKAAKVAEINSGTPRVINFAKMMITDHIKAGDELEKISITKRVSEGDTVNTDHQKMIAAISAKKGAAFDKLYMQMMVNDHQNAVKLFTTAINNKNTDIQAFAKRTLPILKMHLDSANAICASLK